MKNYEEIYKKEHDKLKGLFDKVDDKRKKLVEGLIQEASFLFAENEKLKDKMILSGGMVKFHPDNPGLQKQTEAAKQYLKNVNSYSTVIKTLNSVLNFDVSDSENPFIKWLKERNEKKAD